LNSKSKFKAAAITSEVQTSEVSAILTDIGLVYNLLVLSICVTPYIVLPPCLTKLQCSLRISLNFGFQNLNS